MQNEQPNHRTERNETKRAIDQRKEQHGATQGTNKRKVKATTKKERKQNNAEQQQENERKVRQQNNNVQNKQQERNVTQQQTYATTV